MVRQFLKNLSSILIVIIGGYTFIFGMIPAMYVLTIYLWNAPFDYKGTTVCLLFLTFFSKITLPFLRALKKQIENIGSELNWMTRLQKIGLN